MRPESPGTDPPFRRIGGWSKPTQPACACDADNAVSTRTRSCRSRRVKPEQPLECRAMHFRRFSHLAAVALGAVGIAGCGGGGGSSTANSNPATAAPASSIAFVVAQINPSGKVKSDTDAAGQKILGGKDLSTQLDQALQRQFAKPSAGRLDYEKDVKPWLGKRAAVFATALPVGHEDADATI